jgi:hypothetical protein
MADSSEKFCPWCKANLRPKAVFCHSCGHALPAAGETQDLPSSILSASGDAAVLTNPPTTIKEIANGSNGAATPEIDKTAVKPTAPPRKIKRYVNRTEYVWEEREAPTLRVVLVSIGVFGLVVLILWLNNFLR